MSRYRGYRIGQGGNPDADGARALLATFDDLHGPDGWAETIGNHNRTYQSKQAPLKSVAIQQAAQKLGELGIDSADDVRQAVATGPTRLDALHAAWLSVVSQSSGITWDYFLMLAGIPGVKQDRMVIRFVSSATGLTKRRSVRLTRRPSYGLPQSSSTCRPRPLITPSGGFNLAGAATTLAEPQPHCALMEAQGARAPHQFTTKLCRAPAASSLRSAL